MAINTYEIGDVVRCSVAFTDSASAALDPDVVTFKVLTPAATTTTYVYGTDAELVKDSTGNYHVDVDATANGAYIYRFEGTTSAGGNQGANETYFKTNVSAF